MDLWSKYATITERFEPTKRWEESALVLSLIQAKHWKNQLFNYMFAKTSKPQSTDQAPNLNFGFTLEPTQSKVEPTTEVKVNQCRILAFNKPQTNNDKHDKS